MSRAFGFGDMPFLAEDDRFAIEVEVIASDSGPMAHDRIFGIHLAATIGDVVVIG